MDRMRGWKRVVARLVAGAVMMAAGGERALCAGPAIEIPVKDVSAATLTDEQVVASMNKALDYIFSKQQANGCWETDVFQHDQWHYDGGSTAVVLYGLLHTGQSLKDPRLTTKSKELQQAIAMTRKINNTDLVYLKAIQLQALSELKNTPEHTRELSAQAQQMLHGMSPEGGYLYRFSEMPAIVKEKRWDNSTTQMSLLAAWGISEQKVEVPMAYWSVQEKYWRGKQNPDGGWGYGAFRPQWLQSAPAMTAAGVASLYILDEQLHNSIGLTAVPDKQLEKGMEWLDKNFDIPNIFSVWQSGYWSLFSLERATLASGRKYIGGKDWYREGAAALMKRQKADGSFPLHYFFSDTGNLSVPTTYALIFLARGRNPVAFSKLEYAGNTWNARPQDLANLTRWMGGQFERAINWQTVSMTSPPADPEEWMDAPVLLITGSQDPKFTDEQVSKLRRYVEMGGTIFSSTDGGGLTFTNAMKKYASQICDKRYAMRDLPRTHPIFSTWSKLQNGARLMGMSNGVREVWVHSPSDLGATWQKRAYAQTDQWTLPANVFFYAAGPTESLLPRLRSLRVNEAPAGEVAVKVTVGRMEYAGNWDPEPGAWPRFGKLMRHDAKAVVDVVTVKAGELDASKTPVVHLTGTGDLALSSEAIENLKTFVEHGGTLLIDNATGEKAFGDAVGKMVASLGMGEMSLLAENDPVYMGAFTGGAKIDEADFRKFAKSHVQGSAKDLLGVKKNGRWAVLYAPENITSGLLGTGTFGIVGYEPSTAIGLARNLVFYGASNK